MVKKFVYGPRHAKICLRAYADSDGPDQPALSAQSNQGIHCSPTEIVYSIMYEWRGKARMLLCAYAG